MDQIVQPERIDLAWRAFSFLDVANPHGHGVDSTA
jgi:hypothetical protein